MVENNNNGQKERSRKKRKKKEKLNKIQPVGWFVERATVSDGGQEEEVGRVRRSSSKDYIVSTNEGPFL